MSVVPVCKLGYEGKAVLDPFMGDMQTAISSLKSGRHFVECDMNRKYVEHTLSRIKEVEIAYKRQQHLGSNKEVKHHE